MVSNDNKLTAEDGIYSSLGKISSANSINNNLPMLIDMSKYGGVVGPDNVKNSIIEQIKKNRQRQWGNKSPLRR